MATYTLNVKHTSPTEALSAVLDHFQTHDGPIDVTVHIPPDDAVVTANWHQLTLTTDPATTGHIDTLNRWYLEQTDSPFPMGTLLHWSEQQ